MFYHSPTSQHVGWEQISFILFIWYLIWVELGFVLLEKVLYSIGIVHSKTNISVVYPACFYFY